MTKNLSVFTSIILILLIAVPSFSAQINFTPRLSAGVEYTDNLFLSDIEKESDWITSATPGFIFDISGQKAGFGLSYDPSYNWYSRYDENNGWEHAGDILGWGQLSRNTRLEIQDTFIYTRDPISLEDFTTRRGREPYWRNTVEGRFSHQFGEEDFFRLNYRYRILENDDFTIEDTKTHNPYGSFTYYFCIFRGIRIGRSTGNQSPIKKN